MLSFKQFLNEKIISIGLNPGHDSLRSKHHDQLVNILSKSYKAIGGYVGKRSGTAEEHKAISGDIMHPQHAIKAVRRGNNITAVVVYKKDHKGNRKLIAAATDASDQGKNDLKSHILQQDQHMKRAWGEFSGPLQHVMHKLNFPHIDPSTAKQLLPGKQITANDDGTYNRSIAGKTMTKRAMGYFK